MEHICFELENVEVTYLDNDKKFIKNVADLHFHICEQKLNQK